MFYTIVPDEWLIDDLHTQRRLLTISREGLLLQVEPVEAPYARLHRVFSTDPHDYLDPRWQPGSVVSLTAEDLDDAYLHGDEELSSGAFSREGTPDQYLGFRFG
ncbi:MAG: YlzJ-like family protein [Limnochordia bacterium]|jgi:hypothetical protein